MTRYTSHRVAWIVVTLFSPIWTSFIEAATLTGRVLTEPNGAPVVGATVTLTGTEIRPQMKSLTQEDGTYRFDWLSLANQRYTVDVDRPETLGYGARGHHLYLEKAETAAPDLFIAIPLEDFNQSVSGVVRDIDTGDPVPGVNIGFHPLKSEDRYGVVTDKEGRYEILAPATEYAVYCVGREKSPPYYRTDPDGYEMFAKGQIPVDFQERMKVNRERSLRGLRPGDTAVDLKTGQRVEGINFWVQVAPKVGGSVSYPDGSPVAGLRVHIIVDDEPSGGGRVGFTDRSRVDTNEEGKFSFYLPAWAIKPSGDDVISLTAVTRLPDGSLAGCCTVHRGDQDVSELRLPIRLEECGSVDLHLTDSSGDGVSGATVTAKAGVDFYPDSEASAGRPVKTSEKGHYRLTGLIPGMSYQLDIFIEGYEWKDHPSTGFRIGENETHDAGTGVLNPRGKATRKELIALIESRDPYDQAWAVHLLNLEGADRVFAIPALIERMNEYCESWVRPQIARTLGNMGRLAKAAVPDLLRFAVYSEEQPMKLAAIEALGNIGEDQALEPLKKVFSEADEMVQPKIMDAIGKIEASKDQAP